MGPRAGPVFGNEGIRRPLCGHEDMDSEKLQAVGDAREAWWGRRRGGRRVRVCQPHAWWRKECIKETLRMRRLA